jgi:zinc transport system ATP-binding protein
MKHLIDIKNLTTGYNGNPVLENVSFSVKEQDFVGIIGPNGGGKTTLLKTILGLLKPWKGEITYHFAEEGKDFRRYIGYLPQQNTVDRKFPISVKEVVLSGLMKDKSLLGMFQRKDFRKAEEIMELTGIRSLSSAAIGELSGGQLQRVFLSRAIISSPGILILDEPDTFVDNRFEQELYSILRELNKTIAILLVSHDLGMISSYIKTIACVNRNLHYHRSNEISNEQLKVYNCPIDIITHGTVPHRVLHKHK